MSYDTNIDLNMMTPGDMLIAESAWCGSVIRDKSVCNAHSTYSWFALAEGRSSLPASHKLHRKSKWLGIIT